MSARPILNYLPLSYMTSYDVAVSISARPEEAAAAADGGDYKSFTRATTLGDLPLEVLAYVVKLAAPVVPLYTPVEAGRHDTVPLSAQLQTPSQPWFSSRYLRAVVLSSVT